MAASGVLVAGPSSASASLILFREPPLAYGAASDTTPIALAPLRPSGPADLVAVDRRLPGSIMVRLGNGDGTFGEAVDYPVTGTVKSILVADVNKDGKPDVVAVDQQGFSVLLGNGDGTLKSAVRYTPLKGAETYIGGFALGDFNGDGYPDIAFGECKLGGFPPAGSLVVWLNQKDGTFSAGSTGEAGQCAEQVLGATFHGSSHPADVVTLEAGRLFMHAAKGDGTLQPGQPIVGLGSNEEGQEGVPLAAGDFNGDGHEDFVWAGESFASKGTLLMFPGHGDGSFGTPVATSLVTELAGSLAVADFNRDGIADLAVAGRGTFFSGAQILLGTPTGGFEFGSDEALTLGPFAGAQVAAGDIDGDDYPDLAVAERGNLVPYLNGSLAVFDTESIDFGELVPGGSGEATVTMRNVGDPPLHVVSASIVAVPEGEVNAAQDFTVTGDTCLGRSVTPDSSCQIRVRFVPSAPGERNAALQIESDSPESPNLLSLTGVGLVSSMSTSTTVATHTSAPPAPRPAAPSAAQIAALLTTEVTPAGKAARIATLLKGGYFLTFQALEAGQATVDWYYLPPGAKLVGKSKARPVLVAAGKHTFSAAGTTRLKVGLTGFGTRLLRRSRHVELIAKGTFTPAGGTAVTVTKPFALRR